MEPRTHITVDLSAAAIGVILAHLAWTGVKAVGLQEGFETAAKATGFVGCGKVGEPMMRMPLQKCAALRGFLHDNPKEGKYVVYTDPDITASAPPAP